MKMGIAEKVQKEITERGYYEVSNGVYLQSAEDLIECQDSEEIYGDYPYWILTNDGYAEGFMCIEDAVGV